LLLEKRSTVSTTYVVHNGTDVANEEEEKEEEEEDLERYLPTVSTLPKLPTLHTDVTYRRNGRHERNLPTLPTLRCSGNHDKPPIHVAVANTRNAYASRLKNKNLCGRDGRTICGPYMCVIVIR